MPACVPERPVAKLGARLFRAGSGEYSASHHSGLIIIIFIIDNIAIQRRNA